MPIDFSASVVHMIQKLEIVGQIVASPNTATPTVSEANRNGESPLECAIGTPTSEQRVVDIRLHLSAQKEN